VGGGEHRQSWRRRFGGEREEESHYAYTFGEYCEVPSSLVAEARMTTAVPAATEKLASWARAVSSVSVVQVDSASVEYWTV
jgi:hypothetical protein